MARRRKAKDSKKLLQEPLKLKYDIYGTGPIRELLEYSIEMKGGLFSHLPSIPPPFSLWIASEEDWNEKFPSEFDREHTPASTNSVSLGGSINSIAFNEALWLRRLDEPDVKSAQSWKETSVPTEFKITLFHEMLHIFAFDHGREMCRKVIVFINHLQRRITIMAVADGRRQDVTHLFAEWFDNARKIERLYHSYSTTAGAIDEQDQDGILKLRDEIWSGWDK